MTAPFAPEAKAVVDALKDLLSKLGELEERPDLSYNEIGIVENLANFTSVYKGRVQSCLSAWDYDF